MKQPETSDTKVDMSTIEMTAKHEIHVGSTVSFTDQIAGREQTITIVAPN